MKKEQLFIEQSISKIMSKNSSFTLEDVLFEMSNVIKNIDYYELEVLRSLETLVEEGFLNFYIIDNTVYYTTYPIIKETKDFIGNYIYNNLMDKIIKIGFDNRNGSTNFVDIIPISVSILGDMYGYLLGSTKEYKVSLKRIRVLFDGEFFYVTK